MTEKHFVTWEEVNSFIDNLASRLNPDDVSGVYGIPRGGLVFAVMLSHKIKKPLLMAPCANCVIVDDIADSGKTLLHYAEQGYAIATMFYHQESLVVPGYWFQEKTDKWIVYPWEV